MSKLIDLTNQTFGLLTAVSYDKETRSWLCKCQCGNETKVASYNLRNGHTKSCGCLRHKSPVNKINMINKRFGRAVVIKELERDVIGHDIKCECLCDCGTTFITGGNSLRSGKTQSCGCYNKERVSETHKINMIGKKFGKLLVIEQAVSPNKRLYYRCKCDCGNLTTVVGEDLRSGHTQSCGCLKSKGEDLIAELLRNANIPFEKEQTFETCRFPKTNYFARFDFYVNNSYVIEYDGIQHYGIPNKWDKHETAEERQERDNYKTEWCKQNNIPLIRVPYFALSYLSLEDILIETSKFREV